MSLILIRPCSTVHVLRVGVMAGLILVSGWSRSVAHAEAQVTADNRVSSAFANSAASGARDSAGGQSDPGAGPLPLAHVRTYEVVAEAPPDTTEDGRTLGGWYIMTEARGFEEYGETALQAAIDLHDQFGLDHTRVTIVAHPDLIHNGMIYGWAVYAADGLGGRGLSGANQTHRYTWRASAVTKGRYSSQDIQIALRWKALAPQYPQRELWRSTLVDVDALAEAVALELGVSTARVRSCCGRLPSAWFYID